jgi:hypothetical protein
MRHIARNLLVLSILVAPLAAGAAGKDKDKYQIRATDNIRTILEQEIDLPVKLHLKSGTQIGGIVTRLGAGIVQISEVSGMELYDAVVNIDDISAVLFKARKPKQR